MIDESKLLDVTTLSAKIGQMIRSNELKMAGKLLATARNHLHQLAEKDAGFVLSFALGQHVGHVVEDLVHPLVTGVGVGRGNVAESSG